MPGSSQIGNYDNDGATGERSIAIGVNASASGKFSVAIGSGQNSDGATTSGNYATAVGNGSLASALIQQLEIKILLLIQQPLSVL